MDIPIVVYHPIPSFCAAIAQCLAGTSYALDPTASDEFPPALEQGHVVLLSLRDSWSWGLLRSLVDVPTATVVGLTVSPNPNPFIRAIRLGASGVATETDNPSRILQTLDAAIEGYVLVPSEVAALLALGQTPSVLTESEIEVLEALSNGCTIDELARRHFVSPRTMRRAVSRSVDKLGASTSAEATSIARSLGLIG